MMLKTRREFLKSAGRIGISAAFVSSLNRVECLALSNNRGRKPNIIIILTDDQGFGDIGWHGNKKISTPNLDAFASASVEFTEYYASPVCAPTRASLMTGRYHFRTRVVDTWKGRALMAPEEVTLAEVLQQEGYRTGIFGKWHLGDNYPMRAMDQGFEEAIVHRGGGITQPSCPADNSYFDPVLLHNGKPEKYHGYCMDVYTNEAIKYIEKNRNNPFFVYLATNTPHTPLQIGDEYADPYRSAGLSEKTARLYGMITNIDDNLKRLLDKLKELNLDENTLILFISDNGPELQTQDRYTAGLRKEKGSVYEGGIRVPCFIKWGNKFPPGKQINKIAAHIDIMPTILDACDIAKPSHVEFDGLSLMPLLMDKDFPWPDRNLYFQWHRGDQPQKFRCFAVRNQRYKLLNGGTPGPEDNLPEDTLTFELYDMSQDPFEKEDLSRIHPDIAAKMKAEYETWFKDVCSTRGFEPTEIYIGSQYENPTVLTHEDRKGAAEWGTEQYYDAYWCVNVVRQLEYHMEVLLYNPTVTDGVLQIVFNDRKWSGAFKKGQLKVIVPNIQLPKASGRLKVWLEMENKKVCPWFVEIGY